MVRYSNGIDKKDGCHETHALIFLTKLNMIRNLFSFLKGGVCVFKYFLWISYSNVVVLVKYNQFKKEKKGRGEIRRVGIRIEFICCSR